MPSSLRVSPWIYWEFFDEEFPELKQDVLEILECEQEIQPQLGRLKVLEIEENTLKKCMARAQSLRTFPGIKEQIRANLLSYRRTLEGKKENIMANIQTLKDWIDRKQENWKKQQDESRNSKWAKILKLKNRANGLIARQVEDVRCLAWLQNSDRYPSNLMVMYEGSALNREEIINECEKLHVGHAEAKDCGYEDPDKQFVDDQEEPKSRGDPYAFKDHWTFSK